MGLRDPRSKGGNWQCQGLTLVKFVHDGVGNKMFTGVSLLYARKDRANSSYNTLLCDLITCGPPTVPCVHKTGLHARWQPTCMITLFPFARCRSLRSYDYDPSSSSGSFKTRTSATLWSFRTRSRVTGGSGSMVPLITKHKSMPSQTVVGPTCDKGNLSRAHLVPTRCALSHRSHPVLTLSLSFAVLNHCPLAATPLALHFCCSL